MTNVKDSSPLNLLYVPDDLLLNCLARVSRLYYPALSLVSKKFRSLLASMELYETRKLLGRTESCLYVCLRFPTEINPRWYTLCRRPTQISNPNPNKPSDHVMVSIPTCNYSPMWSWDHISVGSNIYKFGGYFHGVPCLSRVFFMDCRSHTWHEAPSMRVAKKYPSVSVLDGKIYVAESIENFNPLNWIECFDPKTQIWEHVPSPSVDIYGKYIIESLAIKGNLYLFGDKNLVYKPKENRWDVVGTEMLLAWSRNRCCVIDNVLYRYGLSRMLEWYDSEERSWRVLKGLEELAILFQKDYDCVRLMDYGGKITVLWKENMCDTCEIWYAEITLERCNEHEIRGKVEWRDVVLKVPKSSYLVQFIAVTI